MFKKVTIGALIGALIGLVTFSGCTAFNDLGKDWSLIQKAYHEKLLFILKRARFLRFLMAIMYGLLLIRLVK